MLEKSKLFNYGIVLYSLFPVNFAYIFSILSISLPANATIYVLILGLLLLTLTRSLRYKLPGLLFFLIIYILLILWLVYGFFYSPSVKSSVEKLLIVLYNIVSPSLIFLAFFFLGKIDINYSHLRRILVQAAYAMVYLVLLFFLFSSRIDEAGRYALPGSENPIFLSRFLCALAILIIYENYRVRPRYFKLVTLFLLLGLILLTASKGPLLSLIIIIFIVLRVRYSFSLLRLFKSFLLVSGLFIALYYVVSSNYLFDSNFYSVYARIEMFDQVRENLNFYIFTGIGLGSFNLVFFNVDTFGYPHNIFIELFVENGLIGLMLFVGLLVKFFKDFETNIFSLLSLFYLLCAQTSGDISFNGALFIFMLLFYLFKLSNVETLHSSLEKRNH